MALDDDWMQKAACRDIPNADKIFYPPTTKGRAVDASTAKMICSHCPVQSTCLVYAIVHKEYHGIWGGKTASERRMIPREKKQRFRQVWYEIHPFARKGTIGGGVPRG